jgi:hypothetical protein
MKVSKPPSGLVSGHPVGLPAAGSTGAKRFADKLARASGSDKARAATATQPAARAGSMPAVVADIAKAVQAGQITRQGALDRVVERIVSRRVGSKGPAAIREELGAALRQTLEDDPMLAAKIRALDEG